MPLKYNRVQVRPTRYSEMSEGRRTQIVLLDDRRLDIVVQPKLLVNELLNIVASHCHLKDSDKQYFGLAFHDENQQCHWLQNERRVLDHEYPRKFVVSGATLTLFHLPKFYAESITHFAHASCVELMFLHARSQLAKGVLESDNTTMCQLGAYVMQASFGDSTEPVTARNQMKSLHLFTPRLLKDPLTLSQCEDLVLETYQNHQGLSKGRATVSYMTMAEQLQTYGVQIFEVQDKAGVSLTLGISSRGIYQYELNCLEKPRRVFYWKQLENLYYRDRKFSVEVNDIGRVVHTLSSFNVYEDAIQEPVDEYDDLTEAICDPSTQVSVSRRAFLPSGVYVHVFWCESAQLCKTIWSLAIAQHQFYLDRRAAVRKGQQLVQHSVEDLANMLDKIIDDGTSSIGRNSSDCGSTIPKLTPSISSASLRSVHSSERSEEEKQRDAELCKRLKLRRQELEQRLVEKMKELKDICVKEGEVTGELPSEIQLCLAPGEAEPKIKRRVGTAFSITFETMNKHRKADQIAKLEADVDIHKKIVAAALKLATDPSTNKSVRRKRRRDYEASRQRLRELEQRLHQLRISSSKPDLPNIHLEGALAKLSDVASNFRVCKSLPGTPHGSTPDLSTTTEGSISICSRLDFQENAIKQLSAFSPVRKFSTPRPANLPPLPPQSPRKRQGSDQNSPGHKGLQHSTSFPTDQRSSINQNGKTENGFMQRSPNSDQNPAGFLAKPPPGLNGYRSQMTYQSSYRCQNYPTLSSNNVLKANSTSDSNHSLPTSGASSSDKSGCGAVDHSVGAYNIPNQRTSWDYEAMTSGVIAALLQASTESLNVPTIHSSTADIGTTPKSRAPRGPMAGFSADFHAGSLDRRLLNQRQRENRRQTPIRSVDANDSNTEPKSIKSLDQQSICSVRSCDQQSMSSFRTPDQNGTPAVRSADHNGSADQQFMSSVRSVDHLPISSGRYCDHQSPSSVSTGKTSDHQSVSSTRSAEYQPMAANKSIDQYSISNGSIDHQQSITPRSNHQNQSFVSSPGQQRSQSIDSPSDHCRYQADQHRIASDHHRSDILNSISPRIVHKLLSPSRMADGNVSSSPVFRSCNESYSSTNGGIETTKPYETSDLLKYGVAIRQYSTNRFLHADQISIRKFSTPSPTSSTSSPPPPPSPSRGFGSPKRVENWWTSQVANNNARKNFTNFHSHKFGPTNGVIEENGTGDGQESLAWYDDQDPKPPTIV